MKMKNLTPHAITIFLDDGEVTIPASGAVARVSEVRTFSGTVCGITVDTVSYGKVTDLPEEEEGVALIVSAMVRAALPERKDLFSPGLLVRDSGGQPLGCRGLTGN